MLELGLDLISDPDSVYSKLDLKMDPVHSDPETLPSSDLDQSGIDVEQEPQSCKDLNSRSDQKSLDILISQSDQ